jgi:hypothetical protein
VRLSDFPEPSSGSLEGGTSEAYTQWQAEALRWSKAARAKVEEWQQFIVRTIHPSPRGGRGGDLFLSLHHDPAGDPDQPRALPLLGVNDVLWFIPKGWAVP